MKENYNGLLNPTRQVDMEEKIASMIFEYDSYEDARSLTEEECQDLSKTILHTVLKEFRPDLFSGE